MNAWLASARMGLAALICATTACAEPERRAQAPQADSALVIAEKLLPPAQASASVLRVTVTPKPSRESSPTMQATLQIEGQPQTAVRLPPWTLFPANQAATFVVRVPASLVKASRIGQRVVLFISSASASAGASWALPATVDVEVEWDVPRN
jgi:hypothetical protein